MLYSLLSDDDMYYIKVHAECALHAYPKDFFEKDLKAEARKRYGIYRRTLTADVLANIISYTYESKNICMDFTWIEDISENDMTSLFIFLESRHNINKSIYLLNLCAEMGERIKSRFTNHCVVIDNDDRVCCFLGEKSSETCNSLYQKHSEQFDRRLEKFVKESVEDAGRVQHASVPVYLSKYINVKKMQESDQKFFRFCIYELAAEMRRSGLFSSVRWADTNPSFFFHTLNGGYMAAQLADLFQANMVYLDHLGPIETVYRKHFEKSVKDGQSYIIVADVICLGGEISRARTIIEYFGGSVIGEVCMVDVKTVQEEDQKRERISLYSISKEHNSIGYTITTDLVDES